MKELVTGIFIFIMIGVAAMGFIMISGSYETVYKGAVNDTVNNTINATSYNTVEGILQPVNDNLGIAIFMGLLLFIFALLVAIKGVLQP
jgi:hypothetical protein